MVTEFWVSLGARKLKEPPPVSYQKPVNADPSCHSSGDIFPSMVGGFCVIGTRRSAASTVAARP